MEKKKNRIVVFAASIILFVFCFSVIMAFDYGMDGSVYYFFTPLAVGYVLSILWLKIKDKI